MQCLLISHLWRCFLLRAAHSTGRCHKLSEPSQSAPPDTRLSLVGASSNQSSADWCYWCVAGDRSLLDWIWIYGHWTLCPPQLTSLQLRPDSRWDKYCCWMILTNDCILLKTLKASANIFVFFTCMLGENGTIKSMLLPVKLKFKNILVKSMINVAAVCL